MTLLANRAKAIRVKSSNVRETTRKRSLDKEVEFPNSLSDAELDTISGIEPIQAENFGGVSVPASKRRIVSTPRQGRRKPLYPHKVIRVSNCIWYNR